VAGVEQQHAGADQLVLGEPVAVVRDPGEGGDHVVARPLAALPGELAQVVGELDGRPHRGVLRLERRVELVHLAHVGRPGPEQVPVGLGDAEHLRDHGDRERLGHLGDEVAASALGEPGGELGRDLPDPRAERLDHPRGERLGHQPAQPGVDGRLHVEHPGADHRQNGSWNSGSGCRPNSSCVATCR